MHYSDFFSPPKLKKMLADYGIVPKKSLGQNFLFDRNIVDKIITASGITKDDIVVEVGAGLGVLTYPLARYARRVIAYEIDKRLIPILETVTSACGNVEIRNEDIRNFQFSIFNFQKVPNAKFIVVGNLPYYITSRILRQFLGSEDKPKRIVFTVQKEVGARMVAKPPYMSLLSVMVQFYGKPKIVATVSSNCFLPRPKVDSVIVAIDVNKARAGVREPLFFALVKAGFGHKRKLLASNLTKLSPVSGKGADKAWWQDIFKQIGISKNARAEQLTWDDWIRLAELWQN